MSQIPTVSFSQAELTFLLHCLQWFRLPCVFKKASASLVLIFFDEDYKFIVVNGVLLAAILTSTGCIYLVRQFFVDSFRSSIATC